MLASRTPQGTISTLPNATAKEIPAFLPQAATANTAVAGSAVILSEAKDRHFRAQPQAHSTSAATTSPAEAATP